MPFFSFFWGAQPVLVPCGPGLNFAVTLSVQCPRTLAVHFLPTVYRSAGLAQVLPDLVKSLDIANVQCIQFVPIGIVRVTFKESAQCDAALASGISFRGSKLCASPDDARTRLVYVRDLPAEVPDESVSVFLRQYGIVHSLSPYFHPGFPDVPTGTRVVKVTLMKDLPSSVRIAGFDVRLWYQGQPHACPVCRQFGHRVRDCPLNGLCRGCRQPGHMACECTSCRASAAVVSASAPGADPPMSADGEDDPDYVYFSASESDAVSYEEEAVDACSGDEEVLRSAALVREIAKGMRKCALSESFVESVISWRSPSDLPSQSALAGSQPSLPTVAPESSVPESSESVPLPVPELSESVPRSAPPPHKKRFVDLLPSGFSSQQVADALTRPYHGILPRTSYAYVSPDPVKPELPVVMDFGYLTRSVVTDDCTFELDRFVKYVHRKFSRVTASPFFSSDVVVSKESLPAGTPLKFPSQ